MVVSVSGIHDDGQDIFSFPTREAAQKYIDTVSIDGMDEDGDHWFEIQER